MTAGPDEVRGSIPITVSRFERMTARELFDLRFDRFAINSRFTLAIENSASAVQSSCGSRARRSDQQESGGHQGKGDRSIITVENNAHEFGH